MPNNWFCDICGYQYSQNEQTPTVINKRDYPTIVHDKDYFRICKRCVPKVRKLIKLLRENPSVKERILKLLKRK
ncbi:MAG: hypothetical protein ACW98D_19210 [Promethearchaeota archaeon]